MGDVELVEVILQRGRVALESRDPVHLSTPLGWAAFGAVHRRARGGDYAAVVDRLAAAGSDIKAPGNGERLSLMAMAEGNPEVQATLRKHGARGKSTALGSDWSLVARGRKCSHLGINALWS